MNHEDFSTFLFFWGGGIPFIFFWISGCKELIQKDSADSRVCMGECTRIFLDSFWGATGFFNVVMGNFSCVFDAALLHKVDLVMLSMQKMKFTA